MPQKVLDDINLDAIRYDSRLSGMAILFYAEIKSAIDVKGFVLVDDEFYANLYKVSTRTIRRCRRELKQLGYIIEKPCGYRKIILIENHPQIEINNKLNGFNKK